MLIVSRYDTMPSGISDDEVHPITLPSEITSIGFSYDGGRIGVTINGKDVYYNASGSIDFLLTIDNK